MRPMGKAAARVLEHPNRLPQHEKELHIMGTRIIPVSQTYHTGRTIDDPVIQSMNGAMLSTSDVRILLNQISNAFPETEKAVDTVSRMIVHLETLRHEAILPLALGNTEGAIRILKKAAIVEVNHE